MTGRVSELIMDKKKCCENTIKKCMYNRSNNDTQDFQNINKRYKIKRLIRYKPGIE